MALLLKAASLGMPACAPPQGRQVHMAADTDAIENVTFIQCPPERHVRVNVPLKVGAAGRLGISDSCSLSGWASCATWEA